MTPNAHTRSAETAHVRKKCERDGHKFREIEGVPLPYVFCARWRCDVSAVSRFADPRPAVELHNAIPLAKRYPPVDLDSSGNPTPPGQPS